MMRVPLAYVYRYPNPSSFSYERRFFCPFEYALQPPAWYKPEHIALEKPELPLGVSELRRYRGPQCFMIPGNHGNYRHLYKSIPYNRVQWCLFMCFLVYLFLNILCQWFVNMEMSKIVSKIYHCGLMFQTIGVTEPTRLWTDWFDGLHTFMRYICHKSWLGGWFLPQKKSYFALRLPNGWWVFGLDQALHGDIDVYQFKFFAELCRQKVISLPDIHLVSNLFLW